MVTTRATRTALFAAAIAFPALAFAPAASAAIITFNVILDGPSESPPVPSPGTGTGTVTIDTILNTMRVQATFADLIGTVTVSHIHAATAFPFAGTAGVATSVPTFPGFPVGVTSGSYDNTLDMTLGSSFNPAYVNANGGTIDSARAALFQSMLDGRAYLNIHTTFSPGGEIRGFLPAPGSVALMGLAGLALARRRR